MFKNPEDCSSLDELRLEIDKIDKEVIMLLGKRMGFVKEVVKYREPGKKVEADLERFNYVIYERSRWAAECGLSKEVFEKVYLTLLTYFVKEQEKLALELEK